MFCSAFFKNEIPILWGLVGFDGLSQEKTLNKENIMKTITLVSLVTLSLIYATAETNNTLLEYEHQLKSSTSVEAMPEDMSKMKAMGKCGADQKAYKPSTHKEQNMSKAQLEYEHELRLAHSEEEMDENMGNMKAMGKCGSGK